MAVRPIIMFPDPRLRRVAAPVRVFDAELRQLAGDLLETLRAAPGVGITAPHVGVPLRLVVLDLSAEAGPQTYVNPQIVWAAPETVRGTEGSISMPGAREEIERAVRVRVRFQDLEGREQMEEAEGFRAACHQHEIDQLDGVFWIQRLSRLKRERLVRKYEKAHPAR